MTLLSLELIAYQKCYVDLKNGNTDMIPLYLWYNYKHNFELFVFIINDVLQCLNKHKQLPKFKHIFDKIKEIFVSKRDRKYLEYSLADNSNNHRQFHRLHQERLWPLSLLKQPGLGPVTSRGCEPG